MTDVSMNGIVREWFKSDPTIFAACTETPEIAWSSLLVISQRELTEKKRTLLAAGEPGLVWI
jgi:hypothetical protein